MPYINRYFVANSAWQNYHFSSMFGCAQIMYAQRRACTLSSILFYEFSRKINFNFQKNNYYYYILLSELPDEHFVFASRCDCDESRMSFHIVSMLKLLMILCAHTNRNNNIFNWILCCCFFSPTSIMWEEFQWNPFGCHGKHSLWNRRNCKLQWNKIRKMFYKHRKSFKSNKLCKQSLCYSKRMPNETWEKRENGTERIHLSYLEVILFCVDANARMGILCTAFFLIGHIFS